MVIFSEAVRSYQERGYDGVRWRRGNVGGAVSNPVPEVDVEEPLPLQLLLVMLLLLEGCEPVDDRGVAVG